MNMRSITTADLPKRTSTNVKISQNKSLLYSKFRHCYNNLSLTCIRHNRNSKV